MFYGREVEMSHVNCPLCGRNQALSKFNPKALDDDIYVVSFRGLDRGRGFEKTRGNQLHEVRRPNHESGEGSMSSHHRFPIGV